MRAGGRGEQKAHTPLFQKTGKVGEKANRVDCLILR